MSQAVTQTRERFTSAGPCFVLAYCVLASAKAVTVGNLLQHLDPFLLVLVCFSLAAAFFGVTERHSLNRQKLAGCSRDFFLLNASTALSWVGYFLALKELEPAVASSIVLGVGPMFTGFLIKIFRPSSIITPIEKISGTGILFSMFFLGVVSVTGQSAVANLTTHSMTMGLVYSLLGGLGVAGNTIFSKRLSDRGLDARQIMALRFYLLLALAGTVVLMTRPDGSILLSQPWLILAIAGLGIILPLYLLQRGIVLSEPMVVSLILPLGPVFILAVQQADPRLSFSPLSLIGVFLVTLFCALGTLMKYVKR